MKTKEAATRTVVTGNVNEEELPCMDQVCLTVTRLNCAIIAPLIDAK